MTPTRIPPEPVRISTAPFAPASDDLAEPGAQGRGRGLREPDLAHVVLELDVAEHALAGVVADRGLAAHVGLGGQVDHQVDRLRALAAEADEPVAGLAGDDAEGRARFVELDAGRLGGLDVDRLVRIARADLDAGVGAVRGEDPDVGGVEVEDEVDRVRGVEVRGGHGFFFLGCEGVRCRGRLRSVSGPSRCSAPRPRRAGWRRAGCGGRGCGPPPRARRPRPGRSRR